MSPPQALGPEPIFNVPGVVIVTVAGLVVFHALRTFALSDVADVELLFGMAFIPARWSVQLGIADLEEIVREVTAGFSGQEAQVRQIIAEHLVGEGRAATWSGLSYALLHGSWTHVLLNGVWLAAFGSPVARRCGTVRFLALGAISAFGGALAHWALHPLSVTPMIGASAAVSGWMAAAARFVFAPARSPGYGPLLESHERPRQTLRDLCRNRPAAMFVAIWFVTNLGFGLAAAPLAILDASVAWEAHMGGFLAGLMLFPFFDRERNPDDGTFDRA